ncbi:hypothetical protein ERJ75_000399600 [Trypanosoma vivax]|nr:hypothetical protein ERJ75_000399600 [Trypanosoma vivax]
MAEAKALNDLRDGRQKPMELATKATYLQLHSATFSHSIAEFVRPWAHFWHTTDYGCIGPGTNGHAKNQRELRPTGVNNLQKSHMPLEGEVTLADTPNLATKITDIDDNNLLVVIHVDASKCAITMADDESIGVLANTEPARWGCLFAQTGASSNADAVTLTYSTNNTEMTMTKPEATKGIVSGIAIANGWMNVPERE